MNDTKNLNHTHRPALASAPAGAPPKGRWRLLGLMLLLLIGSGGVSFVLFRYVLPSVPRELVGSWQVTQGDLQGATLEFRWHGTGIATLYKNGRPEALESTVKVKGKRIYMTSKSPANGKDDTLIQTIVQITPNELVIRDQDDVTYHLVRIGN